MKNLKFVIGTIALLFSLGAMADPPVPGPGGGVSCDPGCHTFDCHPNGDCLACNADGCLFIPNPYPNMEK